MDAATQKGVAAGGGAAGDGGSQPIAAWRCRGATPVTRRVPHGPPLRVKGAWVRLAEKRKKRKKKDRGCSTDFALDQHSRERFFPGILRQAIS